MNEFKEYRIHKLRAELDINKLILLTYNNDKVIARHKAEGVSNDVTAVRHEWYRSYVEDMLEELEYWLQF